MSPESVVRIAHGDAVFVAGLPGQCWRIHQGAVRLSRQIAEGEQFAGLALAGDLIGVEALLGQPSTFSAHALSDVTLAPCVELGSPALLAALTASEQRAAEALALCRGSADERINRLVRLLAQPGTAERARMQMPSLREMADITNLTQETVSRVVSRLRRLGQLVRHSRKHADVTPDFLFPNPKAALSLAA